ncbi:MAG: hypothetical protein N2C14_09590, partial [Planctomycetales bacterium]
MNRGLEITLRFPWGIRGGQAPTEPCEGMARRGGNAARVFLARHDFDGSADAGEVHHRVGQVIKTHRSTPLRLART